MKNKGTILYIGGFEMPDKNAAAHRVVANGKLLNSIGYNVVYCGISKEKVVQQTNKPKVFFGFDSYGLAYPKSSIEWIKFVFKANFYKSLIQKYDNVIAVICYNLPSGSLSRLSRYCKKKDMKIISDCTEWYEAPSVGNIIYRNVKKFDIYMRMFKLHLKMDGIISISEYLHKFYIDRGVVSIKIPPLVDINDDKWAYPITKNLRPIKLVYSGSPFSLAKNASAKDRLDLVVQSMYELLQENCYFYLNIVGLSKDDFLSFYPKFNDILRELQGHILFHGRVPHAKSISILNESDFSIFIRDETLVTKAGFPTKFVESITLGIPVLTNNNSNVKDYLVDGKNGFLISEENIEGVKKTLSNVYDLLPDDIYKMKQYCKATTPFHFENFKSEFMKLL